MKRSLVALAVAIFVVAAASHYARAQGTVDDSRRSMGNLRPDSYTAGQAVQGSGRFSSPGAPAVVVPQPYYRSYPHPRYYQRYRPYYNPGVYGYYPDYSVPYYYGGYGYRGYGYLPPVFLPAETLYGPQAIRRFMGVP